MLSSIGAFGALGRSGAFFEKSASGNLKFNEVVKNAPDRPNAPKRPNTSYTTIYYNISSNTESNIAVCNLSFCLSSNILSLFNSSSIIGARGSGLG